MLVGLDLKEIIRIGRLFNYDLIPVHEVRERQDLAITNQINEKALDLVGTQPPLKGMAYTGSVDLMTNLQEGDVWYSVIELNGASHRGMTSLHQESTIKLFHGYWEAIKDLPSPALVLMGHPEKDQMIYEKIYLLLWLGKKLNDHGLSAEFTNPDSFLHEVTTKGFSQWPDVIFVFGPYSQMLRGISPQPDGEVLFHGHEVACILGDGLPRRHPRLNFMIKRQKPKLKAKIVNATFPISDDKHVTYKLVENAFESGSKLKELNVWPIESYRAISYEDLLTVAESMLEAFERIVIKPYQGSGGVGIRSIGKNDNIEAIVKESIAEYQRRFPMRTPFPYTLCTLVNFTLCDFKNNSHVFDVRLYLSRIEDTIQPCGGLFRIAAAPFKGTYEKKAFVVNLTGYQGIDIERGWGFSEKSLKMTHLNVDSLAEMTAAAITLFHEQEKQWKQLVQIF